MNSNIQDFSQRSRGCRFFLWAHLCQKHVLPPLEKWLVGSHSTKLLRPFPRNGSIYGWSFHPPAPLKQSRLSIAKMAFVAGHSSDHVPCPPQQGTCFLGVTIGSPTCLHHKNVFNLHIVHTPQECDLHVGASIGLPGLFLFTTLSYVGLPFIGLSGNLAKYVICKSWRASFRLRVYTSPMWSSCTLCIHLRIGIYM